MICENYVTLGVMRIDHKKPGCSISVFFEGGFFNHECEVQAVSHE